MKLPERNDTFLLPTTTLTGLTLMILHIIGYLNSWAWPILYVILLFLGHSQEYKTLFYTTTGEVKK